MSFEELQKKYVAKMYELAGNKTRENVQINDVGEALGLSEGDATDIWQLVLNRGWIDASFGGVAAVTSAGRSVASDYMGQTYAEEEKLVFETILEMGKHEPGLYVEVMKACRSLEGKVSLMSPTEFINRLVKKGFLSGEMDELTRVESLGYEWYQKRSNASGGVSIYNNSKVIHAAPNSINAIDSQLNSVSVNPEFDSAILGLAELIKTSSLPAHEMSLALDDLVELQKLGAMEQSPGIVARGTKVIASFKALSDAAGLVGDVAKYLPQIQAYFQS